MAGSSGLPPHSRLLAREGGEAEAHLGPPFISDTCHLAPNLHQKWTEPHQNGSKIKMHQQNLFVSILMPHADHRASEKKVSIEHFMNILATVSKQTD